MTTHSEMPKVIYAKPLGSRYLGSLYFDDPNLADTTEYIRRDIVNDLVQALEIATDQLEKAIYGDTINSKSCNIIMKRQTLERAKALL